MAKLTQVMINDSIEAFFENNKDKLQDISSKENIVDLLQKEITDYLVKLSQESITPEVSKKINSLMRMANNIERRGGHGEILAKLTNRKLTGNLCLPNEALQDLKAMYQETSHFYNSIITSTEKEDHELANVSLKIEQNINRLNEELRNKNIDRLNKGTCDVISGLIFTDIITIFEKIGDHSFNIGEAVLGIK
jgi:phosphate:Na+ symporter